MSDVFKDLAEKMKKDGYTCTGIRNNSASFEKSERVEGRIVYDKDGNIKVVK